MNEQTAIEIAQKMANEFNKIFVVIKCSLGLCNIMSYENFKLSKKKENNYIKIVPQI